VKAYNTRTNDTASTRTQMHKNKTLNGQDKNSMAAVGKSNINELLGQKP
jgi:hypothetical protein